MHSNTYQLERVLKCHYITATLNDQVLTISFNTPTLPVYLTKNSISISMAFFSASKTLSINDVLNCSSQLAAKARTCPHERDLKTEQNSILYITKSIQ